jgi:hypothetical protein
MDLAELALIIITIALVSIIFFIAGAIVGRDWSATGSYILRIIVVAVVAVFVIPVFRDAAGQFDLNDLGLLVAFVLLVIAVRFIMVDELTVSDDWLAAIVISLLGVIMIYIVDAAADALFDIRLLAIF